MARRTISSRSDVENLIYGCAFMGTGGGGNPRLGVEVLTEALERGLRIELVDAEDVPDEAWTCCAFGMGSIAPKTAETVAEMRRWGLVKKIAEGTARMLPYAVRELESYLGIEFDAVVPIELGGASTAGAVLAAATHGVPVIDGDYVGRAIPEIAQTAPCIKGKRITPLICHDEWGNICIIKEAVNYALAERIGKLISVAGYGTGMAGFPMKGNEMKETVIKGTLSEAMELGRRVREARERGGDPVREAVEFKGGWLLFKGVVSGKNWESREGYMYGTTLIKGMEEFRGEEAKIWFKNENHILWIDGEPKVTSPDLIEVVDLETAEPITNTDLKAGDRVAVIGVKCVEIFRTEKGLEVLGPKHFGFDIEYIPIEERMK
ncbi:MAG: hypothetical protein AYL31_009560 [Candidatus Bathyarchaeota archaeon B26-1]|nr:MAG: hypothetical protein AYL31_009560 [Candidatus Bathyarchaeota archaeon B26-1]